jgi:hypothetical protein
MFRVDDSDRTEKDLEASNAKFEIETAASGLDAREAEEWESHE